MPFRWGKKSEAGPPDVSRFDGLERAHPADAGALGPASSWSEADTVALLGREFPLYTAFLSQRARSSYGGRRASRRWRCWRHPSWNTVLDYDFGEFLGTELPRHWRDMLNADYAEEWKALVNAMPAFDECVGPKVPLQLGGSDDPDQSECTPLVVALSIAGQIWEQTKDLPPGMSISGLSIS